MLKKKPHLQTFQLYPLEVTQAAKSVTNWTEVVSHDLKKPFDLNAYALNIK